MSSSRKHPTTALVALVTGAIAATTALTACTTAQSAEEADTSTPQDTEHADHSDHDHGADNHAEPQGKEETDTYKPRIAVTYDGGIHILDASTLEEVADIPLDGFNRISATGNPRYLAVATSGGFRLLDMGTWAHKHGDHDHYYTAHPQLLDLLVPAEEPGHVIPKAENVTFFDDATGKAWTYTISDLGSSHDPVATYTAQSPHHGFAIQRADGSYVVTEGTHDERNTVNVAAADGKVLTSNSKCPGVHGEAVAADETITVGCQDGILIVKDKTITKVDSPTDYGRIGNQAGVKDSPVVLGDYKSDKDSKTEQPTRVSLTDVEKETLTLVDLPASYSFRSLTRDAEGNAIVLGTDGKLHVIDPKKAQISYSIPVVDAWKEPAEWQKPRPTVLSLNGSIYVTEPAKNRLVAVDIPTKKIWKETQLDVVPNELNGVSE